MANRYALQAMKAWDKTPTNEQIEAMIVDPLWAILNKYDGNGSVIVPPVVQGSHVVTSTVVQNLGHEPAAWGGRVIGHLDNVMKYGHIKWQYPLQGEWLNSKVTRKSGDGKLVVWTDQGPGTWLERYVRLKTLFAGHWKEGLFELAPMWTAEADKRAVIAELRAANAEGAIFSHIDGLYEFGVRSSTTVKYKFTSTADVVVYQVRIKTDKPGLLSGSAYYAIWKDGKLVPFGMVGIGNSKNVNLLQEWQDWVAAGGTPIGEIKYLYATPDSLYQTTLLGFRPDKKGQPIDMAVTHFENLRMGGKFIAPDDDDDAQATLF